MTWLWLLCAAGALTQSGLNLLRPVTSYKLIALDAGPVTIGLVTAAYALLPLFAAVWLGKVSDRMASLRIMIVAGVIMLALGGVGLMLSPNVLGVALASALLGMGHLAFTVGGQTTIARTATNNQLDAGFGWFTASYSLGQMIGPILGGALLGTASVTGGEESLGRIHLALWVGAILAAVAVVPAALRFEAVPLRPVRPRNDDDAAASIPRILGTRGVVPYMVTSLGLLAMIDILTAFLPVVGEEAGVAPVVVGVLLAVRGGASILSRVVLPWLSIRFSRRGLLKTCLLVAAVTLVFPPWVITHEWLAAIFLAVGGFFLGLGQPLTMSMITTAVPEHWRGSALAVRLMGNRLGQVGMPMLAGLVAAPLGPAAAIWIACGVLAVSGAERVIRDR
ncbi:MFS transporter [Kocuria coralli]|uniref:MFS transporter n=2 Tax=Kocuria coralli TaxID=1461025 RepID=A0A5J5KV95_9MICC|nr:MFS transporter [Kocuria coralli]